mgnify:CR=1 FL=1
MAITIDTAFERLNTPRTIFDEKITKANLIPILEEFKNDEDNNDDEYLDWLLYEISEADYFNDMSWILTKIGKAYPKTRRFLENIIENVKKEYRSTELTDLCDVIADKLTSVRSTSPFYTKFDVYTPLASFLECNETFDSATITILNGTHYSRQDIDDTDRYRIRDIYDIFKEIDDTYNAEPIALDTMTDEARRYYYALTYHVNNGESLMPIELEFLERELKKGNPNDTH